MANITGGEWSIICGLGAAWLGWQIVVVGGLPRALRARDEALVERGSPEAFQRFWIDQYGCIGLGLLAGGLLLALVGALR
jgi:hypothetical protein